MNSLITIADATAASNVLRASLSPLMATIMTIAGILLTLYIAFGGYRYITSNGNPAKAEQAKKILRNAFIGFIIIISAGTLVGIMQTLYSSKPIQPLEVETQSVTSENPSSLGDVINEAIQKFIKSTIESIGKPILSTLKQFTTSTPLMAQNSSVFNLWIIIVAIVDTLFLIVIAMIGFRIMSSSILGMEDVDLNALLPRAIMIFITANLSIFLIDTLITISNAMVQALLIGSSNDLVWSALNGLITSSANANIGVLLFIAVAIVLTVMLLVYYLKRLVILYVGAVLSPLVILLLLLPSFKDFAVSAIKMYAMAIFILFVQIAILSLTVSLFSSLLKADNPFMTALLSIAILSVLLSINRTLNHLSLLGTSGNSMRKLGNTFVRGVSYVASSAKASSGESTTMGRRKNTVPPNAHTRAPTVTYQASHRDAARALTSPSKDHEVVITGSTSKADVTVTRIPSKSNPETVES
ncbi:MAG TPA: pilin [Candidatus Saccharimonadales bacterium]|nr:pilin [Candidatus Saccharimonadales bacterium]